MAIKIEEVKPKKLRGFAAMTPERRKEIAARGGRNVKPEYRKFYKDRDLAVEAGRKGGKKGKKGKKDGNSLNTVAN